MSEISSEMASLHRQVKSALLSVKKSNQVTVELPVPSEAVGMVLGTQKVHIKMLRQVPNIRMVNLVQKAPGIRVLVIVGRVEAVSDVVNTAQNAINRAQTALSNQTVDTWRPTSTGQTFIPREVHNTGNRVLPKNHKKHELQQKRIREAAKRFERSEPEYVPPSNVKESKKEIKERSNEFELAREQFEKVKAARAAAAASKYVGPDI